MTILGKLDKIYYKINNDDTLSIVLNTSKGIYLIENYEIKKLDKHFTLKDFEDYRYFNENKLNISYQIIDIKIDYLEMDIRIELDNNHFITIFNNSNHDGGKIHQELDLFLPKDIDADFLEIYNEESESILDNIIG